MEKCVYGMIKMDFSTGFDALRFQLRDHFEVHETAPSRNGMRLEKGTLVGIKTIYHAWDEKSQCDVWLHIDTREPSFSVYLSDADVTQMPAFGSGNTPKEAYAEAAKVLHDVPHGYVVTDFPEEEASLPF